MELSDKLNPRQREAVVHPSGPLIVFAGAGTGKTRVITHRIAHLLGYMGVPPQKILAITFTNKAANEMKKRVETLAGARGYGVWISTFHSFCARILKIDSTAFDVDPNFVIYDEDDQRKVLKEILKELRLEEDKTFRPSVIVEKISRLKDSLIDADSYSIHSISSNDVRRKIFAEIYSHYQKKLKISCALDFGDLILKVVEGLRENQQLLLKYQEKFEHILVDEYQDTNCAQYFLTKYLSARHKNIFIVGDDDQSIYSWRGADRKNIINIQNDYSAAKIIKLEENYRSTPQILKTAVSIIKNNRLRHPKTLWTNLSEGEVVRYSEFETDLQESQCLASMIREISERISYKNIAVLYRMNAQSRVLEDAMRTQAIPYKIVGTVKFYERSEIKDIVSYLRLIINHSDEIAFKRIVNTPSRGIGVASIEKLQEHARKHSLSIFQAARISNTLNDMPKKTADKLVRFSDMIIRWSELPGSMPASEIARKVIEESGYMGWLEEEKTLDAQNRKENLKELVSAIREFEEISEDKSLNAYLENISLISDADYIKGENNSVILTTVHLAKGLEFDVVFLVGLEEGTFPLASSLSDSEELEEERRLCYVALTRAKKEMYMSGARMKVVYGRLSFFQPSRFVSEANIDAISPSTRIASVHNGEKEIEELKMSSWKVGESVRHPVFGEGKIRAVSGSSEELKLIIRFSDGISRNLYAKYANLESVE